MENNENKVSFFDKWQKDHPDTKAYLKRNSWANEFELMMDRGDKHATRIIRLEDLPSISNDFLINNYLLNALNDLYEKVS